MSFLKRLFSPKRAKLIRDVAIYATDTSGIAALGGNIMRIPPKTLFSQADSALGLRGILVSHMTGRSYRIEEIPEMNATQWSEFLKKRFPGMDVQVWTGRTTSTLYAVAVVLDDN